MERLVILDRDGVINRDSAAFIKSPSEWQPLPGSLEALRLLHQHDYRVAVASNQSGIARGLLSESTLQAIHQRMCEQVAEAGGQIAAIHYCPHAPEAHCRCRKPQPGLLLAIAERFRVALASVPFVGDRPSDLAAATAAGARPVLVRSGHGQQCAAELPAGHSVAIYDDLLAFARQLTHSRQ